MLEPVSSFALLHPVRRLPPANKTARRPKIIRTEELFLQLIYLAFVSLITNGSASPSALLYSKFSYALFCRQQFLLFFFVVCSCHNSKIPKSILEKRNSIVIIVSPSDLILLFSHETTYNRLKVQQNGIFGNDSGRNNCPRIGAYRIFWEGQKTSKTDSSDSRGFGIYCHAFDYRWRGFHILRFFVCWG